MRDELTQLYNRRAVFEALGQHLAAARRNQTPLSVLMLDVDNFKSLNDSSAMPLATVCCVRSPRPSRTDCVRKSGWTHGG